MKKNIALLGLMVTIAFAGMAQKKNVTTAIMKDKNGYHVAAKPYIDKACKHEDTKKKAKTWYYKALIYSHISESKKKESKKTSSRKKSSTRQNTRPSNNNSTFPKAVKRTSVNSSYSRPSTTRSSGASSRVSGGTSSRRKR